VSSRFFEQSQFKQMIMSRRHIQTIFKTNSVKTSQKSTNLIQLLVKKSFLIISQFFSSRKVDQKKPFSAINYRAMKIRIRLQLERYNKKIFIKFYNFCKLIGISLILHRLLLYILFVKNLKNCFFSNQIFLWSKKMKCFMNLLVDRKSVTYIFHTDYHSGR